MYIFILTSVRKRSGIRTECFPWRVTAGIMKELLGMNGDQSDTDYDGEAMDSQTSFAETMIGEYRLL